MNEAVPSFYNDLDETLAESWRLIARGVADRRSGFHHPTVATIGLDGRPRLRTVILRGCDAASRIVRFHTDIRSQKITELQRDNRVGLHFYEPVSKIQLRLDGLATLNTDNAVADAAWQGSRALSRQCYGIAPGPGAVISDSDAFTLPAPTDEATVAARVHFCAVTVMLERLEWLYLASAGHRRALFHWQDSKDHSHWLAP